MPNNNLYIELPEFNSLNESNNTFVFDEFSTTTGQIRNLPINIISGLFNTGTTSNDDLEGRFTSAIEIFVDTSDPITSGPAIEFEVSTATLFVKKLPGFSKAFYPISGDPTDGFTFKIEPEELHTNNIDNEGIYTFEVELFGTLESVGPEDGTGDFDEDDVMDPDGDGEGDVGDTSGDTGSGGGGSDNDPESGTGGSDDPPIFD